MSQILTIYVEQLQNGKYRGVPRLLNKDEPKEYCSCRKGGKWFCRFHKYSWYDGNNSEVIAVLTGLRNFINVEQVDGVDRPDKYSPELQPVVDRGEFFYAVVRLSDLLAYDFRQLVSRFDQSPKYPLGEHCSDLLDMVKRLQQAVGETPPELVRLLISVD